MKTPTIPQITFTRSEFDIQVQAISDFLALVHPALLSSENGAAVELRAIPRDFNMVPFPLRFKSYNTWALSDKDKDFLRKFMAARNGLPFCMYYSSFAYDYDKKSYTKAGKVAQKGKITVDAAMFAEEIPFDFDHCDAATMEQYDKIFASIGISPLWVFSGHGYQCHILLDAPQSDKNMLKHLVYLALAKGFDVDPACVDAAHVFRVPNTYNCKAFAPTSKLAEERIAPPLCAIVKLSDTRYSLDTVLAALQGLPTKNEEALELAEKALQNDPLSSELAAPAAPSEAKPALSPALPIPVAKPVYTLPEYPYYLSRLLHSEGFPPAILLAFTHADKGIRHDTLSFLIYVCVNYFRLSMAQVKAVCTIWNQSACSPSLDMFEHEFSKAWPGNCNLKKIANEYGYIDLGEYLSVKKSCEITIPNSLLDAVPTLNKNALKAYLAVSMVVHTGKLATIETIAKAANCSSRTIQPVLAELCQHGHLFVRAGKPRLGEPKHYCPSVIYGKSAGFSTLEALCVKDYLANLSAAELNLYLNLRSICQKDNDIVSFAQLCKRLGTVKSTVSATIHKLEDKGYISLCSEYVDFRKIIYYYHVDILN